MNSQPAQPESSPEFSVLLVDDDAALRANLSDILEAEGFRAREAGDGKTALAEAATQNFDLALVDMRLPDGPGIDVVGALSALNPSMDFVILTGYASLESALQAVRNKSILAYETKPMNIPRLVALIGQVARRRSLEREVLGIAEEERRRFGQELHDGLGQLLTGAALQAKFLQDALRESEAAASGVAGNLAGLINQAITESSRLARGLAPISLETKGLIVALEELAAQTARASGMDVSLQADPLAPTLSPQSSIHLYRIAQEALQNALKHSRATRVTITLSSADSGGVLEVADNGRGLADEDLQKSGMGLKILNYRAALLGGGIQIAPNPGGGTRVALRYRGK